MADPDWIAADLADGCLRVRTMQGSITKTRRTIDATELSFDEILRACSAGQTEVVLAGAGWLMDRPALLQVPVKPLASGLLHVDGIENVSVLPSLIQEQPFGRLDAQAASLAGFLGLADDYEGVICLAGDTTSWVQVSAGEVVSFQTFATGRMQLGVTKLDKECDHGGQFLDAVDEGLARPERVAGRVSEWTTMAQMGMLDGSAMNARLRGAFIGMELGAARPFWLGRQVAVIADGPRQADYVAALERQGVAPIQTDAETAICAGLAAARRSMKTS
ncbi:2-dehydro-3-deoxygalactonokinase [Qingshengfaniella alkalisoli]|uniref:2-dehydro-3-deoxygalactonokinase n=1 Tax=Qingshengfaniella alkalisoli TaxID=2599296 RepID=A0A5B8I9I3_9RHOB|nr:2-dehydro-3-deoxygalactonokinase [Qingshengfaniella alkalisoli]QDY70945.1 2-dehydro-3-deoxygalactonokinase [Qingshengfaniella alkalisoli]